MSLTRRTIPRPGTGVKTTGMGGLPHDSGLYVCARKGAGGVADPQR